MSALRDLIDEIEDLFSKMSRKTKITGEYPDAVETEKLRKAVRKSIRTISAVAKAILGQSSAFS